MGGSANPLLVFNLNLLFLVNPWKAKKSREHAHRISVINVDQLYFHANAYI